MSFAEIIDIAKWRVRKLFTKRVKRLWWTLFVLGVLAIIFRVQLLQSVGNFLIHEDEPQNVDGIFILGGNTYDRSNRAIELYNQGFSNRIIPLGANVATVLKSVGDSLPDAFITKEHLVENGVPEGAVVPLPEGTSTQEESEAILNYCLNNNYKKIIIISDKFHTKRVSWVFKDYFRNEGVEVLICGASHSDYDEGFWWKSEGGLIMVNNEYVKLVYYWLKY